MRSTLMQAAAVFAVIIVWPLAAVAQGTTTTTRPAGAEFSVSTGIGSCASATTHKVEPGPPREGSPIYGLYQSLPDEGEAGPDKGQDRSDEAGRAGRVAVTHIPRRTERNCA